MAPADAHAVRWVNLLFCIVIFFSRFDVFDAIMARLRDNEAVFLFTHAAISLTLSRPMMCFFCGTSKESYGGAHLFQGLNTLPWGHLTNPDLHCFSEEINGSQNGAAVLGEQIRSKRFTVIPSRRKKENLIILHIPINMTAYAAIFFAHGRQQQEQSLVEFLKFS
jgi:hypothetical protein